MASIWDALGTKSMGLSCVLLCKSFQGRPVGRLYYWRPLTKNDGAFLLTWYFLRLVLVLCINTLGDFFTIEWPNNRQFPQYFQDINTTFHVSRGTLYLLQNGMDDTYVVMNFPEIFFLSKPKSADMLSTLKLNFGP